MKSRKKQLKKLLFARIKAKKRYFKTLIKQIKIDPNNQFLMNELLICRVVIIELKYVATIAETTL